MMKTALSIVQSVMYRENLSAPSSLVSQTDPATLQLIHLLNETVEDIRSARAVSYTHLTLPTNREV